MGVFTVTSGVQAWHDKIQSIFVWTVCLVAASTLVGLAEASADFIVSPPSLAYVGTLGGANQVLGVTVTNTGTSALTVTWTDSAPWLGGTSGNTVTMAPGGSASISHTAYPSRLTAAGTYSGTATITGGGVTKSVPMTFTLTSASAPNLGLTPASLAFTGSVGGANPAAKALSITNTGGGTLSWSASDNAAWLTVSPTSGSGPGTATVAVNTAGLAIGTYTGTITVSATGATTKTVPVTLTVTAAAAPGFSVSPPSLAYVGTLGGANQVLGVTVTNTGTSALTVTWTDSVPWLSGTSGDTVTMAPGGSASISHTAYPSRLTTAGTYSGTATITGGGVTKSVPMTFTLTSASAPNLGLTPASLAFTGSVGGANPAAKALSITNTGGGTLSWSASDNAAWLTVSPTSGSGPGTATVGVNTAGLAIGTYTGTITVSATGATTKTVPVTLTVTAAGTGAVTLSWNPSSSSDAAGYKVFMATTSGGYGAPLVTLAGNVLTYQAAGLPVGTTYFFTVVTYDAAGNISSYSNEVSKSIF